MVTRMRRNSENLLLLAGHEGARKWSDPVSVADVARAATSEIEHYSRVVLNIQPGVAVIGTAVSDVVHLLAELIENATLYSPSDTTVRVSGHELPSGGVLIEITDKGIGIPEERLAEMNWRLQSTPAIDVSVSRHMGLFAVARLAERHGVQVRLRPANPQGLSALVWLPDTVIEHTALPFPGRRMAAGYGQCQHAGQADARPARHHARWYGRGGRARRPVSTGMVSTGPQRVEWFRRRADRRPASTARGGGAPATRATATRLPHRAARARAGGESPSRRQQAADGLRTRWRDA